MQHSSAIDPSTAHYDVLIVGAGQAGAQAAISLRQGEFAGSIAIVGDETHPPYERPPLSKEYLAGEKLPERMHLRPRDQWAQRRVELILGEPVARVNPELHRVETQSGKRLGYGSLVWATGGTPRRLNVPGADLKGVHAIRTMNDVDALREDLKSADHVAIVGGGYIGLEVAAILAKQGKHVTIVEAVDRVLARVTCEAVSRFYESEHRSQGVDIRLNMRIAAFAGRDGRVCAVRFADDDAELPCDVVIVGVGIIPSIAPLAAAGAAAGNGVDVDEHCRTSLPDIYAIGDCANHPNRFANRARIRLESVQNANDQAKVVAASILGKPRAYEATPWFWSNQYDLKLQTVGLSHGHDAVVLRGDPATRSFSAVYLKEGRVIALDCINAPREFMQGRALVERSQRVDPVRLADAAVLLKSFES